MVESSAERNECALHCTGIHLVLDKCFLFPYLFHRYVEQSNSMMEKRNSSLQTATESTQARILHAEQEKVK